ncbi:MAG: hypothetical protein LBI87_03135 [Candidatus Accumulibacter sp.]|nr:hypothetical protein [Accumulibacter sp.]
MKDKSLFDHDRHDKHDGHDENQNPFLFPVVIVAPSRMNSRFSCFSPRAL